MKTFIKARHRSTDKIVFVRYEFEGFFTDGKDSYSKDALDFINLKTEK